MQSAAIDLDLNAAFLDVRPEEADALSLGRTTLLEYPHQTLFVIGPDLMQLARIHVIRQIWLTRDGTELSHEELRVPAMGKVFVGPAERQATYSYARRQILAWLEAEHGLRAPYDATEIAIGGWFDEGDVVIEHAAVPVFWSGAGKGYKREVREAWALFEKREPWDLVEKRLAAKSKAAAAQDLDKVGLADAALELLEVATAVPFVEAEGDEAGDDVALLDLIGEGVEHLEQAPADATVTAPVVLAPAVAITDANERPRGEQVRGAEGVRRRVALGPDADLAPLHLTVAQGDLFDALRIGDVERGAESSMDTVRPAGGIPRIVPRNRWHAPPGIPRLRRGGLDFRDVMNVCHPATCVQVEKHYQNR